MRVGLIATPWTPTPPLLYGGIELVVDRLARGFSAAGHDVVLFATGDSTCPVPRHHLLDEADGERIGNGVTELRHALAAYECLRDEGCDVIHDHTLAGPLLGPSIVRDPRVPIVTTVHGPLASELLDVYRHVAAAGGGRVSLIAVSHAQRRPVPALPVAAVIHHGIDAADFPVGRGDGGYALFLGRMSPDKGAHRAIAAARKAGVPLVLAGKLREDAEHAYFDSEVRPLLGLDAEYVGEVPHDEKVRLLAGACALLFPIRWNEPFGLVMLEAMACGTPVLAFREGAAPEVVEDGVTGYLCDDEAHMAECLTQLDTLSRAACRRSVETAFSTARMAADHIALFDRLVRTAQS
jgi:glycosyltransferase involved in cell wall biosynthesis